MWGLGTLDQFLGIYSLIYLILIINPAIGALGFYYYPPNPRCIFYGGGKGAYGCPHIIAKTLPREDSYGMTYGYCTC